MTLLGQALVGGWQAGGFVVVVLVSLYVTAEIMERRK